MANLIRDLRFACRSLAKNPVISAAVVAALALGIGANTVVFSLIDTLLLRPVPGLHAPDELVAVFTTRPVEDERVRVLRQSSHADYLDYRRSGVFSGLAAHTEFTLSLTHEGASERLTALAVSDDYFAVLGVKGALGRLLAPGGDASAGAVVSHGLWRRRFGGDPDLVGRTIHLNGRGVTVIGVTPRGFRGTSRVESPDVWVSLGVFRDIATGIYARFYGQEDRRETWLQLTGRLAPGVTPAAARSALEVVARNLAATYPETNEKRGVAVLPLTEAALGAGRRHEVLHYSGLLMTVVGVVLLVACLDVASLLSARALARRREIAVRLSLGASRVRLVRLLASESLVLALAGGTAGVALAGALLPLVERLRLPVKADFHLALDGRLLAFAFLVSLASALVFGLAPAIRWARADLVAALRREVPARRRLRLGAGDALVAVQVALALVVLIGSGLMVRTLANLGAIDPGYDPQRTLVASLDVAPAGYEGARVNAFYDELLARVRALPGVEAVSMASALPMVGAEMSVELGVFPEDGPAAVEGAETPVARHALVGGGYFETLGMKLLRGRDFAPRDTSAAPGVVIVNETMARRLWPHQSPLGRRLSLYESGGAFEVIGVVSNAKYGGLKEEPQPVVYLYHGQQEKLFLGPLLAPSMTLIVRARGEPRSVLPALRRTVAAMDPQLPVFNVRTLPEILSSAVVIERQVTSLFSAFALLAVMLVTVGLYALMSQSVARRRREIGIRMACGAPPAAVGRLVLVRGAAICGAGVVLGFAAAAVAGRAVASYLYGVTAADPSTWAATSVGLVVVTLWVSAVPARRAARIDPVTVLREE